MCRFCVLHGDGEKWYLKAENHSAELADDIRRREYVVDFVADFETMRARAIAGLEVLDALPDALGRFTKDRVSRSLQEHHFGQPLPIEDVGRVLDITSSIVQLPCACRTFSGAAEEGFCFAITTRPIDDVLRDGFSAWSEAPDVSTFERLTKEQALARMRSLEREGLMHSVWTFVTPFIGAICNCDLPSGCMAMRLTLEYGTRIMWKGHYVADVDREACAGCGNCRELCPFGAVEMRDGTAQVSRTGCWGCGVCRSACDPSAISLLERAEVPEAADLW